MQIIGETLPGFQRHLSELIEGIGKVLAEKSGEVETKGDWKKDSTTSLYALRAALEVKNMRKIDKLLEELEELPLDAEMREAINAVSDKALMGEYEGAIAVINEIDDITGGGI
jgi:hypothetical protein